MKACSSNRKLLADLALDQLDVTRSTEMRLHMESCEGCRIYFESLAEIYAGQRGYLEKAPEAEAGFTLHHNLMAQIHGESRKPDSAVHWVKWAAAGACLLILMICVALLSREKKTEPRVITGFSPTQQIQISSPKSRDFQPTLSDYRRKAGRSFENLDALLSKEAERRSGTDDSVSISTLIQ